MPTARVGGRVEHVFVSEAQPPPAPRAAILHADLDAFYASVEQRDDSRLRGRPIAVGGGVVLAASYEAKRRGVATAMGARQACALCPDLIVVRPRFDAYLAASRAVFELFHRTSPVVQGVSIDEAFLDVRGLHRIDAAPVEIARRLRAQVRDEDGLLLVEPQDEQAFLHPLAVERLWGVGDVTAAKLHS